MIEDEDAETVTVAFNATYNRTNTTLSSVEDVFLQRLMQMLSLSTLEQKMSKVKFLALHLDDLNKWL